MLHSVGTIITDNAIGDEGVKALCRALEKNTVLRVINLSCSSFYLTENELHEDENEMMMWYA